MVKTEEIKDLARRLANYFPEGFVFVGIGSSRSRSLLKAARFLVLVFAAFQCSSADESSAKSISTPSEVASASSSAGAIASARAAATLEVQKSPAAVLPRFQLAVLAERERKWEEAVYWFEEALKIENTSALAAKMSQELVSLHRLIEYERTPVGRAERTSLDSIDASRRALVAHDYPTAHQEALQALTANPKNWEAYELSAIASIKQQDFASGILMSRMAKEQAPQEKSAIFDDLIVRCEKEIAVQNLGAKAAQDVRQHKWKRAGDQYAEAWKLMPSRPEGGVSALKCYVLAGDYSTARTLLQSMNTTDSPKVLSPAKSEELDHILVKLVSLSGKHHEPGQKGEKSTASRKAATAKKSMADDFLSKIKK